MKITVEVEVRPDRCCKRCDFSLNGQCRLFNVPLEMRPNSFDFEPCPACLAACEKARKEGGR